MTRWIAIAAAMLVVVGGIAWAAGSSGAWDYAVMGDGYVPQHMSQPAPQAAPAQAPNTQGMMANCCTQMADCPYTDMTAPSQDHATMHDHMMH